MNSSGMNLDIWFEYCNMVMSIFWWISIGRRFFTEFMALPVNFVYVIVLYRCITVSHSTARMFEPHPLKSKKVKLCLVNLPTPKHTPFQNKASVRVY